MQVRKSLKPRKAAPAHAYRGRIFEDPRANIGHPWELWAICAVYGSAILIGVWAACRLLVS
jgi:hypothetical protein